MHANDPLPYEQAHAIAEAARALTGVAGLHAGDYGEIALLFAGGRVPGLKLVDDRLLIHIVANLSDLSENSSFSSLAQSVRSAAAHHTDRPIDVVVADAVVS